MIFKEKFFRKDLEINYVFDLLKDDSNLVLFKETLMYKLYNKSSQTETYTFEHYFENVYQHPKFESKIILFRVTSQEGVSVIEWEGNALLNKTSKVGIRQGLKGNEASVKIAPGQYVQVEFCHETIRRLEDSHFFITVLPADSLEVSVIVQNGVRELSFHPDSAHKFNPQHSGPKGSKRWVINQALLPGHGFLLHWCPASQIS